MHWGSIYVPLEVEVEPSYKLGFPAEESAPYLGSYDYLWGPSGGSGKPIGFAVFYEKGNLMARWDPAPYPEWATFALIRIKDDWFIPAFLDKQGALFEVAKEMVFEFKVASGRASGFDVRGEDDKVMATGKRKS